MNWVSVLCDLYDKNANLAGEVIKIVTPGNVDKKGKKKEDAVKTLVLLPESHTTVLSHIEVTIDEVGNFLHARKLDKSEATTIVPVTEESGNRTSGTAPHPLCDNLKYLAGDYDAWVSTSKKEKSFRDNYESYIKALQKWCDSKEAHPKAIAVLKCLEKGRLIHDLVKKRITITMIIRRNGRWDWIQIVRSGVIFLDVCWPSPTFWNEVPTTRRKIKSVRPMPCG